MDAASGQGPRWVANAAPTGRPALNLTQPWAHRELALYFALRDVKARYKQAFLGVAWAGLQPLAGAVVFTFVFNGLADISAPGRSYLSFALVGFVVWSYASTAMTNGANSLVQNADLLTKVAFPRIVGPAASLLPPMIDLLIGCVLAAVVSTVVGDGVSVAGLLLALPLGLVLLMLTVAGPVLFFSASVVKYRDATVLLSFALQLGLFASPVAYPPSLVAERWRDAIYANPVTGVLGLFRAGLVDSPMPSALQLGFSFAVAVVSMFMGLLYFRRNERELADII